METNDPQKEYGAHPAPVLNDAQAFDLVQRQGKALMTSTLVPKDYQGNLGNCLIALEMSARMGIPTLMVMQNLYIVHGRPGWSSTFLIASINQCGRFTALRYEEEGDSGSDNYRVRAWANEKSSGERLNGTWITWAMVKAEGWLNKSGSKWKTMPDQMFKYRAAAFWQRAYAPEISMGFLTKEEAEDVPADHQRGKVSAWGALSPKQYEQAKHEIQEGVTTPDMVIEKHRLDPDGEQAQGLFQVEPQHAE